MNDSCDFMTDGATLKNLSQQFKHENINYTIVIPDVEQMDICKAMSNNMFFQIGLSDYPKPSIWLDAGIHAREWIAPSTAIIIITELLENYDRDASVRAYVDLLTWYILPVVNPDGLEFSRASNDPRVRLWRKNRSAASCILPLQMGQHCCLGVDLNRNFDFNWGEVGGSNDPCEEVYHGSGPFSEPETDAIRRFISSRSGEFVSFITLHSYSQMWMYPYGHRRQAYSSDVRQLRAVALRASQALYNVYNTRYEVGTGADLLYPASGGSEDWAKAKAGIKYSYLLELRPHKDSSQGFLLDESQIIPTGKETWEGIRCVADAVISTASSTAFGTTLTSLQLDMDPFLCRWWAANGGCHMVPSTALRCPRSCRIC
ncbi:Carboxypeptidase A1 [Trichuris trichiura]|uniref:Carboxypeptidase A1 n=1 Tax=Trichuris trichiura TaxID=36087 RepID=A0A077ZDI0_TRITR|nr:Carboxypeptidase A1 [Trichuris trichiura]